MARNIRYICDTFWGEEFNSTDGFNAVNKRMKESIDTCSTLLSVVRQRAKCEEDFSKSLMKNFKQSDCSFNSEIGRLFNALESLSVNSDKIATEHQASAKELSDCADRLQRFHDVLKAEWKVEKDKAKKIIQEKQRHYDRTMLAKRAYHDKSKCAEQADIASKFIQNPAALEKALKNKERTQNEASRAESTYRENVNSLDEARDQWERELHRYFVFCEDKDKERIKVMQNEIWILTNILSSTYVAADKCCEDVRIILEKVSPEAEIKEFVEKNQTGSIKPAAIQFERYTNVVSTQVAGSVSRNSAVVRHH